MRDETNILQVASFVPDYMGFIFYPASPRYVGDSFEVPADLHPSITRVGVFVNESTNVILEKIKRHAIKYVQLHANETAAQCQELRDSGVHIIKVFSVDDSFDFQSTKPYVPVADFFLFDTKGKFHGGNGTAFNWEILKHYDQEVPFFLSGGLTSAHLDTISELQYMNLHALDLNSGVEQVPGLKDIEKVKAVFAHSKLI